MNKRTRAYTRHQRARTIERKWFILKHIWQREPEYMPVKGTLSKNKNPLLLPHVPIRAVSWYSKGEV
ncbi:hypothetical protein [Kurthia sp. Dielmo]|uniref:hypothetical protein n=1 Tax=Kurthia sp. Dielmo TaxID=1033738 RepID=UPI0021035843|nr:hypothetical protein [Kurthia sp. Dielmo]